MRPWLVAMLLLMTVLAGCQEPGQGTDDGDDGDGGDDGNGGDDGGQPGANNTAPTANLTADVLNGTAPLAVNLTLDGADADGDNLSWVLRLDGNETANGTTLPAQFNTTLARGYHLFVLDVTDGNETATANLTIDVAPGADVPGGPCGDQPEPCKVDEDLWAEFWSDGVCHAKGELGHDAAHWIHDRPGTGDPPFAHYVLGQAGVTSGGGIWVYEESNGVAGLQLGGTSSPVPVIGGGEVAAYADCADPDTLIF